jgi:hypothetical protein
MLEPFVEKDTEDVMKDENERQNSATNDQREIVGSILHGRRVPLTRRWLQASRCQQSPAIKLRGLAPWRLHHNTGSVAACERSIFVPARARGRVHVPAIRTVGR